MNSDACFGCFYLKHPRTFFFGTWKIVKKKKIKRKNGRKKMEENGFCLLQFSWEMETFFWVWGFALSELHFLGKLGC